MCTTREFEVHLCIRWFNTAGWGGLNVVDFCAALLGKLSYAMHAVVRIRAEDVAASLPEGEGFANQLEGC